MKEIVKEAEDAGIFKVGENKRVITDIYLIKVDEENASGLDMIKREKGYGYKLIQINFEFGLISLIKPIRVLIKEQEKKMFKKYIYEIKITQIKDTARRAWSVVSGNPSTFYFQGKNGYINQVNTLIGKAL